jgi:hypothetical protein
MISDISAIAYDWLSTGNPILLTKPVEKKAIVEEFPLVDRLYSITAADLDGIQNLIADQFKEGSDHKKLSSELNAYYFKQPTNQSDVNLENAISQAIELRKQKLLTQVFPKLNPFDSRRGTLGWLRYPNFVIREALRFSGTWSTAKQLAKVSGTKEFFVHLSDPFNRESVVPSVTSVLREHQKGHKLVLVLNQVTSLLEIQNLLKKAKFKPIASDVVMIPVANAADCEMVVAKLTPESARYLKHHPLNHMLLRLNGLEHVLWRPDLDPLFTPDHSLITYDKIEGPSHETAEFVNKLLDFSRPELTLS